MQAEQSRRQTEALTRKKILREVVVGENSEYNGSSTGSSQINVDYHQPHRYFRMCGRQFLVPHGNEHDINRDLSSLPTLDEGNKFCSVRFVSKKAL